MTKTASTENLQNALQEKKTTTPTGVDPYKKAQAYLKAMTPQIAQALPKAKGNDAERWTRIALTTLRQNPKLMECSIESLLGAVLQSAQLGLEPNLLGQCYFIPFKGQVSFQIGYKGLLDLVTRSGAVTSIVAQEVRQGDHFHFEYGRNETLKHVPAPMQDRGEPVAYYAYAHLKNGGFVFQVMSVDEINKIRDNHSISFGYDKKNSIWAKHYTEMAQKTVIKRLIKYLPISVEVASAVAYDETVKKDITAEVFTVDAEETQVEIIEAE